MQYVYRKAELCDLELLVKSRVMVLRAANKLSDDADMSKVESQSREYYKRALADGSHTAYLVFDGQRLVGTGGMSYYSVMPTCDVPSGKKAYVMKMYTDPGYRRQGIAYRTLDLLVADAKARGVEHITLEATDMGRPLYEKYGFVQMQSEMQLKNAAQCTEKKCRCCR